MAKQIAQITDLHLDETHQFEYGVDPRSNWKLILEDVQNRGVKTIIFTGDIGETAAYEWFLESLRAFEYFIIPGNHDFSAEVLKVYNPPFSRRKNRSVFLRGRRLF